MHLPHDPVILFLGIQINNTKNTSSKIYMHINIYYSLIYNILEVKPPKNSKNRAII